VGGLLDRLLRRYRWVADLGALAGLARARVEIEGDVEAIDTIEDPLGGRPCVAIGYRAWPPSTTLGMDGGTSYGSRAYQVNARQAVDFVLGDGHGRVLVQVSTGEDVGGLHRRLLARFGVGLRAEVETVEPGTRLRVAGRVMHASRDGSPHRRVGWSAVVRADRFWVPRPTGTAGDRA
jgi:hypothetical protein